MSVVAGVLGIVLCGILLVYILAARNFQRECFQRDFILVQWMKSAGYSFYCKIMCPYVYRFRVDGGCESSKNYKRLQQIYVKKDISEEWRTYQAEKYALILTGALLLLLTGSVFLLLSGFETVDGEYQLQRPQYGQNAKKYAFVAENENGESEEISLVLDAQMYSEEEVQRIFQESYETLKERVKGENASLQKVRTSLNFQSDSLKEGIEASWYSSNGDLITEQGEVLLEQAKEGENAVVLYLILSYEQYSKTFEIPITVVKYASDTSANLQTYLNEAQKENLEESVFTLPEQFAGQKIQYKMGSESSFGIGVFSLLCTVLVLLLYKQQQNMKEQCEKRERQMKADYPEIISKLVVLIRAGLPVRRAWLRMAEDYQREKARHGKSRFAWEEICLTAREMQNGKNESEAYLHFGKRCEQHLYMKLGSLLEQNLKKGNASLAVLLENERIQALEERRRQVKAAGEVAGTKLMMPMIALFALVLLIIMVPSFMTFGM